MNLQVLTLRTVGRLLFGPLVAIMLIKKSVPGESLLNVNVLHIREKSPIKILSSETCGILCIFFLLWTQFSMLKHKWLFGNHSFLSGEI